MIHPRKLNPKLPTTNLTIAVAHIRDLVRVQTTIPDLVPSAHRSHSCCEFWSHLLNGDRDMAGTSFYFVLSLCFIFLLSSYWQLSR